METPAVPAAPASQTFQQFAATELRLLLSAALTAAEKDKPAILAALAKQNAHIETLIIASIKANVKNVLLATILVEFAPQIVAAFPSAEDAAFISLDTLLRAEINKL